ncbi:MAG: hypothetical protein STSR0008_11170 [Ignavibacterium sp.]
MKKIIYLTSFLLFLFLVGCESSIVDDPALTIEYTVPELSKVKLTLDNSYNTTIKILVDQVNQAGVYQVTLDIKNFPEGVYFYTLELKGINSDYYSKTTKNLLLKK